MDFHTIISTLHFEFLHFIPFNAHHIKDQALLQQLDNIRIILQVMHLAKYPGIS
jgi:hypothetical protein